MSYFMKRPSLATLQINSMRWKEDIGYPYLWMRAEMKLSRCWRSLKTKALIQSKFLDCYFESKIYLSIIFWLYPLWSAVVFLFIGTKICYSTHGVVRMTGISQHHKVLGRVVWITRTKPEYKRSKRNFDLWHLLQ